MSKRRLKLLGKILLGLIALLAAFLLIERWRGQIALARLKQELRVKGEKLSPQDFARVFDEEDNGAPTIFAALERLTNRILLPDSYPPRMQVLKSGRAIVGFREPYWVEKDPYRNGKALTGIFTNHWSDLAADLQTNKPALNEIQTALTKPVLNNRLDLAEGSNLQFSHLLSARNLTRWLGSACQFALHHGRTADATKYLSSELNSLRLLAEDGVVISELVRIAMGAIARTDTWEALQSDDWADADLAAIQHVWETQYFMASMATNLEGERIYMLQTAQQLRDSNDKTYDFMFGDYAIFFDDEVESEWVTRFKQLPFGEELLSGLRRHIYCRAWRFAWSHQAERRLLKNMQTLIELSRAATTNASFQAIESDLTTLIVQSTKRNGYDRLRFPPPDSVITLAYTIKKSTRAEIERALCITAIALKRYSLRHGKLPDNLNALVPEFLSAVPVDYMDGKPLKYRLNTDGSFTLYSVGEDGLDDGGNFAPREDYHGSDLWKRLDYVWPAPATPEEVEEFRQATNED